MPKKKKMSGATKAIIAIAVIAVVVVIIIGYIGVVRIPGITPSSQALSSANEIYYYDNVAQLTGSEDTLPLDLLTSYGLEYHFYGTDDSMATVMSYYESQKAGWSVRHSESGPDWQLKIWSNLAYGFGIAISEDAQVQRVRQ